MGVRFENGFLRNESDAGKPVSRTVEMIQHLNDEDDVRGNEYEGMFIVFLSASH